MTRPRKLCAVICASALSAIASADVEINVGRFANTYPHPNFTYAGDWAGFVGSEGVDDYYTVLEIDLSAIMNTAGERYLRTVTIRDHGGNTYGDLSPGADIDFVSFEGLHESIAMGATYVGSTAEHLNETNEQLMGRIETLDAFNGANQRDDDVYVSLGQNGLLELNFSGGSSGGGDDGDDGGWIDTSGGLAGGALILRIAEAGAHEEFTIHLETSSIPAPAGLAVMATAGLLGVRSRRR